MTKTQPFTKIK